MVTAPFFKTAVVHTLDMQYHCMDIIQRTIEALNPDQMSVDICDEPIFALTKEIQWRYPERFGLDIYFSLFGSLHIEKSIEILNAELIKGSGLDHVAMWTIRCRYSIFSKCQPYQAGQILYPGCCMHNLQFTCRCTPRKWS
jgi:hypothetical protein